MPPIPMRGMGMLPPHFLGPPVQQPGMPPFGGGMPFMDGMPPGLNAPPPGWAQGNAAWKQPGGLGMPPGLSPLRQPGPNVQHEEAEPDPMRAAALIEMGKFMQQRGKMHQQRIKLRESHQSLKAAMEAARPQGRY